MLPRTLAALRQHGFRTHLPRSSIRTTATQTPRSRISRLESRLPAFLRRYTTPLRTAPVSHITAFALLHELTAIVPVFGLTAAFYYLNWLPPWLVESQLVKSSTEKVGKYLRKKGWIDDGARLGEDAKEGNAMGRWKGNAGRRWAKGEDGVRLVMSGAAAYAATKALLPVRIAVCFWATPWFARWTVVPVSRWVQQRALPAVRWALGVQSGAAAAVGGRAMLSPVAGTNAIGGGALPASRVVVK